MFQGSRTISSQLRLSSEEERALLGRCNQTVTAIEQLLNCDFSNAICEIKIIQTAKPFAWSFGDAFDFKENGTINVSLFAHHASVLSSSSFLNNWLDQTLAHDWHHAGRILKTEQGYGTTIGEILVSEGLALRFQEELTGLRPWLRWPAEPTAFPSFVFFPTAPTELQKFFHKVSKDPSSSQPASPKDTRLYGNKNGGDYPYLCGYALADRLLGSYLQAHNETASSCLAVEPDKVIGWILKRTERELFP